MGTSAEDDIEGPPDCKTPDIGPNVEDVDVQESD